jgi:mRNA degradation ribonuclease J1/J2
VVVALALALIVAHVHIDHIGRLPYLLAFIQGIPQASKAIRLIHGERDAREALKAEIDGWAEAYGHAAEVTLAA